MKRARLVALCAEITLAVAAATLSRPANGGGSGGAPSANEPTPGQVQAARELFAAASEDERAGRWGDALAKLRRVADVKPTAGVRYHVAFCEEKLGQIATALAHYTEAREVAERDHAKDVLALLKDPFLPDLRARVPTLSIEVTADATGAVVTIDGHTHPQGLWGVGVPMDPGLHHVAATAPGCEPFARDITLHEREVTMLDVVLRPTK
jgi:hypothetical protein